MRVAALLVVSHPKFPQLLLHNITTVPLLPKRFRVELVIATSAHKELLSATIDNHQYAEHNVPCGRITAVLTTPTHATSGPRSRRNQTQKPNAPEKAAHETEDASAVRVVHYRAKPVHVAAKAPTDQRSSGAGFEVAKNAHEQDLQQESSAQRKTSAPLRKTVSKCIEKYISINKNNENSFQDNIWLSITVVNPRFPT